MTVSWSFWGYRRMLVVPGLIVVCLLTLYLTTMNLGMPVISQLGGMQFLAHSHGQSCKYDLILMADRPTALARQAGHFRVGDAMNNFGVWAYQDTHAIYVRLGVFTTDLSCVPLP
jgi:hypothetical protein